MSTNETPRDSADDEALRREIQAAIKAGRELDPEMDRHLADSVLDRYREEQTARNKALARPQTPAAPSAAITPGMPGRPNSGDIIARTVMGVALIGAFAVLLAFHWQFFWLIFFLPGLLGGWWGWGRWDRHGGSRYGSRAARRYGRIEQMRSELGPQRGNTVHYD